MHTFKRMAQYFFLFELITIVFLVFHISHYQCLPAVNQTVTNVEFDEADALLPSTFQNTTADRSSPPDIISVYNRTKMIVANEIFNLPRFDPRNYKNQDHTTVAPPIPTLDPLELAEVQTGFNSNDSNRFSIDSCDLCLDTRYMQHYFSKKCIAMELREECKPKFCPKYFSCPQEKKLPNNGCLYQEKFYKFGANVPHRDPCQHCVCVNSTNGPMLSCAISECFEAWTPLKANCYRKYHPKRCCPEIVCNLPDKPLETCAFEGEVYSIGDYFSPQDDPCVNCLCDQRWNSTTTPLNTSCTRLECHFDFDRPENRGCVPVYGDKSCCPMYYHCPDVSSDAKKPKCKFGGNTYELGEKIKVKRHEICLECSCSIPPEISCKHKTCMPAPYKNCTSLYHEGECCPQYKCELEMEDSLNEDSERFMENSVKVSTANSAQGSDERRVIDGDIDDKDPGDQARCEPLKEDCKEPICRVIFEEVIFTNNDTKRIAKELEKNNFVRIKCPKCRCDKVVKQIVTAKSAETVGDSLLDTNLQVDYRNHQILPPTLANTSNVTSIKCDVPPCFRMAEKMPIDESVDAGDYDDDDRWAKSLKKSTTTTTTTSEKRKIGRITTANTGVKSQKRQCPDVACEFPCYIYTISVGDCPRCGCPDGFREHVSPETKTANKVMRRKFVATSIMRIKKEDDRNNG